LAKVAKRVNDNDVMHLLKIMLKANGRCNVPQGGVVSPLLMKRSTAWPKQSLGTRHAS